MRTTNVRHHIRKTKRKLVPVRQHKRTVKNYGARPLKKVPPLSESEYYDLVEIKFKDGKIGHIPAPFFRENEKTEKFLEKQKQRKDFSVRDEVFYKCPFCGEKSFFTGPCDTCMNNRDKDELKNYFENRKKLTKRKKYFFKKLKETGKPPKALKTRYVYTIGDDNEEEDYDDDDDYEF